MDESPPRRDFFLGAVVGVTEADELPGIMCISESPGLADMFMSSAPSIVKAGKNNNIALTRAVLRDGEGEMMDQSP